MNANWDGMPDYARIFIDGLKEAGVWLVTAFPRKSGTVTY